MFFLLLSTSFIRADQLTFHTTFSLSALAVLSEYDNICAQRMSRAKHAFTFQNYLPSVKRALPAKPVRHAST